MILSLAFTFTCGYRSFHEHLQSPSDRCRSVVASNDQVLFTSVCQPVSKELVHFAISFGISYVLAPNSAQTRTTHLPFPLFHHILQAARPWTRGEARFAKACLELCSNFSTASDEHRLLRRPPPMRPKTSLTILFEQSASADSTLLKVRNRGPHHMRFAKSLKPPLKTDVPCGKHRF